MLITHGCSRLGLGSLTSCRQDPEIENNERQLRIYIIGVCPAAASSCNKPEISHSVSDSQRRCPVPTSPPHRHHRALQRLLMCYTYNTNMRIYTIYVVFICLDIYQCLQTCRLSRMCVTTVSLLSRVCLSRLWMTCLQFACWFVFLFLFFSWYSSASFLCFIKASCSANYKKILVYDGQPETRVFCESRKR